MAHRARIAPPYSVIASTESCIAIGCRSDADGDTEFVIGHHSEVNPGGSPAFEGTLKTPHRRIAVQSVVGDTIMEMPVSERQTMVYVWVNDVAEPDRVVIGIEIRMLHSV